MTPFNGFSKETVSFFAELAQNNQRAWFEVNRERYQKQVILPAQAFVLAMGDRLRSLSPDVIADPRGNGSGSIFRLHRDTRFSKDKTPYKTNLGIFFWHGSPHKGNQPGFYFHLEPEQLALYGGQYVFEKETMERYRHAVTQPESGRQLLKAVKKVESYSDYQVGGLYYKRIPRGFSEEQDPRDFLLYNTFYTMFTTPLPAELYSKDLIDYCYGHFKKMFPVLKWLLENLQDVP